MYDTTPSRLDLRTPKKEPSSIDVTAIREAFGMTIRTFATTFRFRYNQVRDWERGTVIPLGHDRTLLIILREIPATSLDIIRRETTVGRL